MTIKTQQRALLVIIGIIFAMLIGIVVRSNHVYGQYQSTHSILIEASKEISDINMVSVDYFQYYQERPLNQIEQLLGTVEKLLKTLQTGHPERITALTPIQQDLERAQKNFEKLKRTHNSLEKEYHAEKLRQTDPLAYQQLNDHSNQFSISTQALDNSIHELLKSSMARRTVDLEFYDQLLMSGMIVSFIVLVLVVVTISHRLVSSVEGLKNGAAHIASGNLAFRVELTGNDEFTDLTRSLNIMSQKLQVSYDELEDEIEERKRTEESLLKSEQQLLEREENVHQLNTKLEKQLIKLQEANREMESFTYSVSHDLRSPLRHLTGFVELLERRDISSLDEKSRHYLKVISEAARKMGCLIDDLLSFSRMGRGEMAKGTVDLMLLAREVIGEIEKNLPPGRIIQWRTGELPTVTGDLAMLRLVLQNLISNAVKYSQKTETPLIEVDVQPTEDDTFTLFVRDNGSGFDMKYVDKLFGLFQRLHSSEEFEGTGVGLANVRRIIVRHGGRTWAEGELNKGATFYFSIPQEKEKSWL